MSTDYPPAAEHFVPRSFMFESNAHVAVVIHKTGGDATPQAVYNTFLASGNPGNSTHYAVGQDGSVWQYVPEQLGAGGNGRVEPGYDPFWEPYLRQYSNLNLCTLSIEHCDGASDNSTPLTPAQRDASFKLVAHLVQKYGIPPDHIKTHASIDPINRARCPGNYPMADLLAYLQHGGEAMSPYSSRSTDFASWFERIDTDHWRVKKSGVIVQYAILQGYCQLSLDGQTLPVVGLPTHNEQYRTINGKQVVIQLCERAALCYDPQHVKDRQPGMGEVYLLHLTDADLLQALGVGVTPEQLKTDAAVLLAAAQKLAHDSGLE